MACTTGGISDRKAWLTWLVGRAKPVLFGLAALPVGCCSSLNAQRATDPPTVTVLAEGFLDARALDTDSRGRFYVLDGARATITQLDSTGHVLAVWGGTGSGDSQFDEPSDIDATNGLELFVADTGNRRIKRFSGEFVPLESIPLDLSAALAGLGDAGRVERDPFRIDEGRPIGVRLAGDGSLFALDAERNVVVKWTRNRRLERIFGGYEEGEGALVQPTSMTLGPDGRVYVGDAGRGAILVFDPFGSFVRALGGDAITEPVALKTVGRRLLVIQPGSIVLFSLDEGLLDTIPFDLEEPLVDATVFSDRLIVLTPRRLLRVSL